MYPGRGQARKKRTEQWRKNYMLTMNRWGRSADDPTGLRGLPDHAGQGRVDDRPGDQPTPSPLRRTLSVPTHRWRRSCANTWRPFFRANFTARNWIQQIVMSIWDAGMYGAGNPESGLGLRSGLGHGQCGHPTSGPLDVLPRPQRNLLQGLRALLRQAPLEYRGSRTTIPQPL